MWPRMIRARSSAGSRYHSRCFHIGYTMRNRRPDPSRGTSGWGSSEYTDSLVIARYEWLISAYRISPLWFRST